MPLHDSALRLLRALHEPAVFLTPRGDLLAANRAALAALSVTDETPTPGAFPVVPSDASRFAELLRQWSRSPDPTPGSFVASGPSGPTDFSARGSVVVPARDGEPAVLFVRFWLRGDASPFVLLNQKLTELHDEVARRIQVEEALRRSEATLQERIAESEALHLAKDEFLAIVSHELRTPLHAILGWTVLLGRQATDAQAEQGLEVIRRNAMAQANLVDDILDMSRIITGKMRLETRMCDLAALVEQSAEVLRPSAQAKAVDLHVVRPPEACMLLVDPDRISQVVWNLLSNAVKFTGRGGTVRASLAKQGSQYALEVRDTGIGIDPTFLPYVFDRFQQADSSNTRRTGGVGLGLALVRHIVELHGGSTEAHSNGQGTGATFAVRLPIRAVAESALPAERPRDAVVVPPPAGTQSLHGLRVLVVDDERDARELLGAVLRAAGGEVQIAASASEARDALTRSLPHVLVSDVGMPGENGYSLMRQLRESGVAGSRSLPALALTAYTRHEDREQALDAGFTAHLGKPVQPDELVAMVAMLGASQSRPGAGDTRE